MRVMQLKVVWNVLSVCFLLLLKKVVKVVSMVFVVVIFMFIVSICIMDSRLLLLLVMLGLRFFSVSVFIVVNCIELMVLNRVSCMMCRVSGWFGVVKVKLVIVRLMSSVLMISMWWQLWCWISGVVMCFIDMLVMVMGSIIMLVLVGEQFRVICSSSGIRKGMYELFRCENRLFSRLMCSDLM